MPSLRVGQRLTGVPQLVVAVVRGTGVVAGAVIQRSSIIQSVALVARIVCTGTSTLHCRWVRSGMH